jgi:hypothetical protein
MQLVTEALHQDVEYLAAVVLVNQGEGGAVASAVCFVVVLHDVEPGLVWQTLHLAAGGAIVELDLERDPVRQGLSLRLLRAAQDVVKPTTFKIQPTVLIK